MKALFDLNRTKAFGLKSLHRLYNHVFLSPLQASTACGVFPDLPVRSYVRPAVFTKIDIA